MYIFSNFNPRVARASNFDLGWNISRSIPEGIITAVTLDGKFLCKALDTTTTFDALKDKYLDNFFNMNDLTQAMPLAL
jgi:hypothetical protein